MRRSCRASSSAKRIVSPFPKGLVPSFTGGCSFTSMAVSLLFGTGRQMRKVALHVDKALVVGNNTVNHGKTQAGSLALLFGREKRLKDTALDRRVHTDTRILHGDAGILFRSGVLRDPAQHGAGDPSRYHLERPAARHRVPSVEAHVQYGLMQQVGVAADRRRRRT